MNRRILALAALASALLAAASILLLDEAVARVVAGRPPHALWSAGVEFLELAFGMTISKWALGLALVAGGAAAWILRRTRTAGRALLFVGLTHLTARLVAGTAKNVFGRARPHAAVESGDWDALWFSGGAAFPSGHAAYFWGLYFPLALLWPRWRLPLAVIPLFVSAARVAVNDHWVSDVLASATIAALAALLFARVPAGVDRGA